MHRLARSQQCLRRDACPVRALAPHELALHHGHAQAALGQSTRAVLTRRSAAEHDDVVLAVHVGSSSPARSRTMYSAYQSGQSGSASPVRSSCLPCASDARLRASESSLTDPYVVLAICLSSQRPGSRVLTSWSSQPLPSGSLNAANEP